MPIKPENRARYPKDWKTIRAAILERAGHCCEGSPAHPECRAANYEPHPEKQSTLVVLTIAHLDHTPENCDPANLAAWCQRCHLEYDEEHHRRTAWITRRNRRAIGDVFETGKIIGSNTKVTGDAASSRRPGGLRGCASLTIESE